MSSYRSQDPLVRRDLLARWGTAVRLARVASLALLDLLDQPVGRQDLLALLELLGRLVRLATQVLRDLQGPLAGPASLDQQVLGALREQVGMDQPDRLVMLGHLDLVVEPDPQVLLVLALLAQRDLLDSPVGPDQPAKMAQPVLLDPPVLAEKSETRA